MNEIKFRKKEMQVAYGEYAALRQRIKALEDHREKVNKSIPKLNAKIEEAEQNKKKVIADHVAGVVSVDVVAAARSALDVCCGELEQAKEILEAIKQEYSKANDRAYMARAACGETRKRYCAACAQPVEEQVGKDAKVRRLLLDVYAAWACVNDSELGGISGQVDWELMLSDVFAQPTGEETEEAMERFMSSHMRDMEEVMA